MLKKTIALVVTAALAGVPFALAGTVFVGSSNQQVNFGGAAQPVTLSGASTVSVNGSTVAVTNVNGQNLNTNVAAFGGSSVSLGQTTMSNSLPVAIASDQTAVSASQSGTWNVGLNAGANQIGTVSGSTVTAYQGGTTPFTENLTQVGGASVTLGAKTTANSIPVTLPTDQGGISVNGSTVAVVGLAGRPIFTAPAQIATIAKSSQSVTTSSVQMFGANSNRVGIECVALPGNTDYVACAWAATAAATDSIIITQAGSWEPPKGIVSTLAFSCISNSGTQVIRCTEYSLP